MHTSILPCPFLLLDHGLMSEGEDVLLPFAYDDYYCRKVGLGHSPIIHMWRHPRAFVMGLRDYRLQAANTAIDRLHQEGYSVAVRNSGGAAVPLDSGVLNISVILPNLQGTMEHRKDFELMVALIREVLASWSIVIGKGEVQGSYCPGDYDLSVEGRKFCGISQRRQTKASVVQAFINVEGNGVERAERVHRFYQDAAGGSDVNAYPLVQSERMVSLAEIDARLTIHALTATFVEMFIRKGGVFDSSLSMDASHDEIRSVMAELKRRYRN